MLYVANYGYLSFSVIWTLPIFKRIGLLTLYKICILYIPQDPQEALPILLMVWPLFEVNPGDEISTYWLCLQYMSLSEENVVYESNKTRNTFESDPDEQKSRQQNKHLGHYIANLSPVSHKHYH